MNSPCSVLLSYPQPSPSLCLVHNPLPVPSSFFLNQDSLCVSSVVCSEYFLLLSNTALLPLSITSLGPQLQIVVRLKQIIKKEISHVPATVWSYILPFEAFPLSSDCMPSPANIYSCVVSRLKFLSQISMPPSPNRTKAANDRPESLVLRNTQQLYQAVFS